MCLGCKLCVHAPDLRRWGRRAGTGRSLSLPDPLDDELVGLAAREGPPTGMEFFDGPLGSLGNRAGGQQRACEKKSGSKTAFEAPDHSSRTPDGKPGNRRPGCTACPRAAKSQVPRWDRPGPRPPCVPQHTPVMPDSASIAHATQGKDDAAQPQTRSRYLVKAFTKAMPGTSASSPRRSVRTHVGAGEPGQMRPYPGRSRPIWRP